MLSLILLILLMSSFTFSDVAFGLCFFLELFSYYLRILKDKCAPGLELVLYSPPKPHSFTNLPLQSSTIGTGGVTSSGSGGGTGSGSGGGTGSGSGLPGSNTIPTCDHYNKHSFTFRSKE
jgi:uncharacterized membrane protein YgcG